MRDKILIAVIFSMLSLLLVPPLFREGAIFDYTRIHELCDGSIFIEHGIYFDQVFNTILLVSMSYLGLIIPYLKPDLNKIWKGISSLVGAWFLAGLIYQIVQMSTSEELFKYMAKDWLYVKSVIIFTLGLTAIITNKAWTEQKR